MPHNEGDFKVEFRKALEKEYGETVEVWTNNDMFRAGLPDFNVAWTPPIEYDCRGIFLPIEAKFVKKLPVKQTSLLPGIDLSGVQANFLSRMQELSLPSAVLIGFEDVAVACPFDRWPREDSNGRAVPVSNITLAVVMKLKDLGFYFPKTSSGWQVKNFLQRVIYG